MKKKILEIVRQVGTVSSLWLKKNYFFRRKAVKKLVSRSGFSAAQAEAILDAVFSELTEKKLMRLLGRR